MCQELVLDWRSGGSGRVLPQCIIIGNNRDNEGQHAHAADETGLFAYCDWGGTHVSDTPSHQFIICLTRFYHRAMWILLIKNKNMFYI